MSTSSRTVETFIFSIQITTLLAIGINDYADVADVPFADRSAQQFAQIAERLLGAQKQNVIVLTNAEATLGRLRGRIRTMLNRLGPQDQLLFYFAGHGVPGKDGSSTYLLAQDGGSGSYEEPAHAQPPPPMLRGYKRNWSRSSLSAVELNRACSQ